MFSQVLLLFGLLSTNHLDILPKWNSDSAISCSEASDSLYSLQNKSYVYYSDKLQADLISYGPGLHFPLFAPKLTLYGYSSQLSTKLTTPPPPSLLKCHFVYEVFSDHP